MKKQSSTPKHALIMQALQMLLRAKALYDSNSVGNQGYGIALQEIITKIRKEFI
jgi:hypothetical protein